MVAEGREGRDKKMVTGREQGDEGEGKEDGRGWWKGRDKKRVTGRERGARKGGWMGRKDGDMV